MKKITLTALAVALVGTMALAASLTCAAAPALAAGRAPDRTPPAQEAPKPLTPNDFAHTAVISAAAKGEALEPGRLYRLELTPEVLLRAKRADGADLVVFNAAGRSVPIAVRARGMRDARQDIEVTSLYPLWGKAQSKPEELVVTFGLDKDMRLVPKLSGAPAADTAPAGQELKGYVIPLPEGGMPLHSLAFTWAKGSDNATQFALQTGSDLQTWQTLSPRAQLVRFDGPSGPLESNVVNLKGAVAGKYLRLLFEPGHAPESISAVQIERRSSERESRQYGPLSPTVKAEVAATPKSPRIPAGVEYSLSNGNGTIPVDSLQLFKAEPGQYARARVLVSTGQDGPWRQMGPTTFFAVYRNGELFEGPPLALHGVRASRIRLEAVSEDAPLPEMPTLAVNYAPLDIYLLAQGQGPYTLAFGSNRSVPADECGVASLWSLGSDVSPAALGPIVTKEIPADTQKTPPSPQTADTGPYVLWGLLVCGVLLLAFMAFRLVRGMKKE